MIRFVDLGRQLYVDEDDMDMPQQFCFYNTTVDQFVTVCDTQVWRTWADFEKDCALDNEVKIDIKRFKSLCPKWVFK